MLDHAVPQSMIELSAVKNQIKIFRPVAQIKKRAKRVILDLPSQNSQPPLVSVVMQDPLKEEQHQAYVENAAIRKKETGKLNLPDK